MIKVEPCSECGRTVARQTGLNVVVEPIPLDAQEAVAELMAGRRLWANGTGGLRPALPGEPGPAREHRCPVKAAGAVLSASVTPRREKGPVVPPKAASGPSVAFSTPSLAPRTDRSSASRAANRGTETECSECGYPIALDDVDTYALIELGATLVDAFHTGQCPRS